MVMSSHDNNIHPVPVLGQVCAERLRGVIAM